MIPSGAKRLGASRPKKMNPRPADLRSRSFRAAVMPISRRNRQSAPWKAAMKKTSSSWVTLCPCSPLMKPMVMPPKSRSSPGLRKTSRSNWRESSGGFLPVSSTPSSCAVLPLVQREIQLLGDSAVVFGVQLLPGAWLGRGAGRKPRRRRWGVAVLTGHVAVRVHPLVPQPCHQKQCHQTARDLHHGQHHRHVRVEGHARR